MEAKFAEISQALQNGKSKIVKELIEQALADGASAADILENGLLAGMGVIADKFQKNEVFVPQVLLSARAMNNGVALLKPYLDEAGGSESVGKVILGTVKGDLHDIGKNLVRIMMEGKGIEVVDMGTDVSAQQFYDKCMEENATIVCCSALLTSTMPEMRKVVQIFEENGTHDKVTIFVGGAPVTEAFCKEIGADVYTNDATAAANRAKEILSAAH